MKRLLAIALTMLMLLAACPLAASAEDLFAPYEETVVLTVGRPSYLNELPDGGTLEDNAYLDFLKEYLNVEIHYDLVRTTADDYMQALNLAITGDDLPDVVFFQSDATTATALMQELAENEMCYDITDLLDANLSDALKARNAGWDDPYSNVTFDDRIMGLQRNASGVGEWDLVHIREDWLKKLDIQLDPDGDHLITMDELMKVVEAFVANDPGQSGNPVGLVIGNFTAKSSNYSQNLICNYFGAPVSYWYQDEQGNVVDGSTVPEIKDAMAWYADLYQRKLFDQQVGITNLAAIKAMCANGQLGVLMGAADLPNWVYPDAYKASTEADFIMYGLDRGDGTMINPQFSSISHYMIISAKCEHPEAALKVMSLTYSLFDDKEFAAKIGETYPEIEELAKIPNFLTVYNPFYLYMPAADETYLPYRNYMAWSKGEMSDEEFAAYNINLYNACVKKKTGEELTPYERLNYDWNVDGYGAAYDMWKSGKSIQMKHLYVTSTPTMATNYADMKKSMVKWWIKAITGEVPVEEAYNAFVEEYNALGGTQINKEIAELYVGK